MLRAALCLASTALLGLLAACIPDSYYPLSQPGDYSFDSGALGVWSGDFDGLPTEIHISQRNTSVLDVTVYENWGTPDGGADDWDESYYWAHFTDVGGYNVVNVAFDSDDGTRYFFADYAFGDDGALMLWFMDQDIVAAAIRAGALAGTVEEDPDLGDFVTITDRPENILALIRAHEREEIFTFEYGPFYRR